MVDLDQQLLLVVYCFVGDVLNLKVNRLNKVKNVYKFEGKCLVDDVIHAQCIFSAMIHDIPSTSK